MRQCHIVLLYSAAAAVLLCLSTTTVGRERGVLKVQRGQGARIARDHATNGSIAVADQPSDRKVWLYSLIGTDFPGDLQRREICEKQDVAPKRAV
jgi:hypothetical protein